MDRHGSKLPASTTTWVIHPPNDELVASREAMAVRADSGEKLEALTAQQAETKKEKKPTEDMEVM